jgi:hypothetical protein
MRPASAKVMDEAIDLAIEGRSPYPERAAFIDADTASAGHEIKRAADEGLPVVLVAAVRQLPGLDARSTSPVTRRWGNKWGNMPHRSQPIPAGLDPAKTA